MDSEKYGPGEQICEPGFSCKRHPDQDVGLCVKGDKLFINNHIWMP